MPRWLKHIVFVLFLVVFAGCAGSCSSCSGCGMTPLPGGFPSENRIENSASVRLTDSGLKFLGDNLGALAPNLLGAGSANAGVITFDVPKSSFNQSGFNGDVCPNGSNPNSNPPECVVESDLSKAKLTVATKAPHNITVKGTLPVRLQKLPVKGKFLGFISINVEGVLTNGGKCSPKDYAQIPVDVDISLEADDNPAHVARKGYTKVKIVKIAIDNNAIENSIHFCGGGIDDTVVNLVKGFLIGSLIGGLTDTLTGTIEDQLCAQEDPATGVTCPTGTYPDSGGTCRYCQPDGNGKCTNSNDECVAIALGVDGNINLSSALSSLSPGTKGGFDFLAALGGEGTRDDASGFLWGDLNPVNGGATIGMMGGAEPTPITQCVPIANLTKPANIPVPDELTANTVPGWTGEGPHVGFALSERYLNYALGAVYNSGALCLGVGSSTFGSLLNSDTIGLLIPSFKDLARGKQAAPLALILRPQEPPSAVVGKGTDIETDPLLNITLNKLNIDFYVWSSDRYIRAFTAQFDVIAPVNLDVTPAGLAPVIDKVQVNNPSLANADLLREDEQQAAEALASIVASQIGSALGGAISPIDLNSSLASTGLTITIPPTVQGQGSPGLTKLEKGTDRFLGLFAALGVAPAGAPQMLPPQEQADTAAEVTGKKVELAGLTLPTITKENRPTVDLRVSSPLDNGSNKVEYQYRLDGGFWHPWTYDRNITLTDPELSIQARHHVEVRARLSGVPTSMDTTPVKVEFLIDKTPPDVTFGKKPDGGKLEMTVRDVVSPQKDVKVRWAVGDGDFGEWVTADAVSSIDVGNAETVKVEATDEEGNIGTVQHSIIRGEEDAALATGSGCNCSLPGTPSTGTKLYYGFPALLGLALSLLFRRRRNGKEARPSRASKRSIRTVRVIGSVALMAVAASWSGCSCGSDEDGGGGSGGGAGDSGKPPGACPEAENCEVLDPGLVGAYASAVADSSGTIWVAGYDDIGYGNSPDFGEVDYVWGDLVVGKYEGGQVVWQSVDGLPAVDDTLDPGTSGGPPDPFLNDITGFRRGLTEAGDDVGAWTSIALVGDQPAVAYYDITHRALKYAAFDGTTWAIHTVQQNDKGDIGRYAKLLIVDGKPVIAYQAIEATADGAQSAVRVATASSATPGSTSDWTFADAVVDPATPCRAYMCGTDVCVQDTGKCTTKAAGCDPKCGSGEACIDNGGSKTCAASYDKSHVDTYPAAIGGYISLAKTSSGLGIAYYDRLHGNLMAVRSEGGTWQPPVLLDGQANGPNGPEDTGDVGIGTSLFVDSAGDWHVSYVNGFDETLVYQKVTAGTTPGTPEVVDDGATADGQAIVGDDSSIFVTSTGEVQIAYQDATNGELRWATGAPNGATHSWTKKTLTVSDFAGAFSQILQTSSGTQVLTWWRRGKPRTEGDVAIVSP